MSNGYRFRIRTALTVACVLICAMTQMAVLVFCVSAAPPEFAAQMGATPAAVVVYKISSLASFWSESPPFISSGRGVQYVAAHASEVVEVAEGGTRSSRHAIYT